MTAAACAGRETSTSIGSTVRPPRSGVLALASTITAQRTCDDQRSFADGRSITAFGAAASPTRTCDVLLARACSGRALVVSVTLLGVVGPATRCARVGALTVGFVGLLHRALGLSS